MSIQQDASEYLSMTVVGQKKVNKNPSSFFSQLKHRIDGIERDLPRLIEIGQRTAARGIDQLRRRQQAAVEVRRRHARVDDEPALRRPLQLQGVPVVQGVEIAGAVSGDGQERNRSGRVTDDAAGRMRRCSWTAEERKQRRDFQKHVASSSFG